MKNIADEVKAVKAGKTYFLNSVHLEHTNRATMCTLILDSIKLLGDSFDTKTYNLFIVTDGVAYMFLFGKTIIRPYFRGVGGANFQAYVDSLDSASRGNFTVHNARTKVEHALGVENFLKSETGGPGRYTCYLQYVRKARTIVSAEQISSCKQEALNLAFLDFPNSYSQLE
ncbi:hypothetical protein DAPPUDRAFT_330247 [Daphnia pulex]|uniref:Uncharacterized protein n=1 Tax=Daphnia pulex TaxID=6669 RepID=E9HJ04_DAPPU|nr:hypothetical protein DAPPUDRAFT_330247 [Daphnia pulex]|eukprot:EFX68276.1 hypothetical protein DAPPUDRAFT_330247 [Daphnia pulex]